MLNYATLECIPKKDYYLDPAHRSHLIGFTLEGVLKSYFNTNDGGVYTKSFITPFDICSSFPNPLAKYNSEILIQAITNAKVLSFNLPELDELRSKSRNLEIMTRKILELEFWKNEKKEYLFITKTLEENYLELMAELGEYSRFIKKKEVANYLGITEVALSRIRKRMGQKENE